jgi:hypothetical protein
MEIKWENVENVKNLENVDVPKVREPALGWNGESTQCKTGF